VLLDDVQLLLDDLVGGFERGAAAVPTERGAKRVLLCLEVRRQRLAAGRSNGLLLALEGRGLLGRLRALLERPLRVADQRGLRLRRFRG
jgi:hypothetical protein